MGQQRGDEGMRGCRDVGVEVFFLFVLLTWNDSFIYIANLVLFSTVEVFLSSALATTC